MSDAAGATETTQFGGDARPIGWQQLDRWIFAFMTVFILATVLVGFAPASLGKIAAVEAGQRPPFPPVLHVHAVLMGSWVLLLLAQAGLDVIADLKARLANIALWQIRAGILFPVFVIWALLLRKKDPATHKRLLILATLILLPAAIDRIGWLPTAQPFSPDLYMLLWAVPLFAYDVLRHGRVPGAYLTWLGLFLPLTIPVCVLHDSPWWLATAPKLMGVESW